MFIGNLHQLEKFNDDLDSLLTKSNGHNFNDNNITIDHTSHFEEEFFHNGNSSSE